MVSYSQAMDGKRMITALFVFSSLFFTMSGTGLFLCYLLPTLPNKSWFLLLMAAQIFMMFWALVAVLNDRMKLWLPHHSLDFLPFKSFLSSATILLMGIIFLCSLLSNDTYVHHTEVAVLLRWSAFSQITGIILVGFAWKKKKYVSKYN